MTLPEIRKRLRFWKKELNLNNWTIYLRLAKPEELTKHHAWVEPLGYHDKCRLVIGEGEYAEYWLLHELTHLVLDGLSTECDSKAAEHLEERAVNRLTTALARAKGIPCPPFEVITGEAAA